MIGMDEKALQCNVPWISKMKGNIWEKEWNKSAKKLAKTKLQKIYGSFRIQLTDIKAKKDIEKYPYKWISLKSIFNYVNTKLFFQPL